MMTGLDWVDMYSTKLVWIVEKCFDKCSENMYISVNKTFINREDKNKSSQFCYTVIVVAITMLLLSV